MNWNFILLNMFIKNGFLKCSKKAQDLNTPKQIPPDVDGIDLTQTFNFGFYFI